MTPAELMLTHPIGTVLSLYSPHDMQHHPHTVVGYGVNANTNRGYLRTMNEKGTLWWALVLRDGTCVSMGSERAFITTLI